MNDWLGGRTLEELLGRFADLRIGLIGDLFLDKYLELDPSLTEISIETGLEAYQVVRTRCYPGAGGTVLNNLRTLGVGELSAISVVGDDGEGFELLRELRQREIDCDSVLIQGDRATPTYTKPVLLEAGRPARELNRLDIKNRFPPGGEVDRQVIRELRRAVGGLDALIVADQVTERNLGVITDAVREELGRLGRENPKLLIFADSRSHLGLFRQCTLKPNRSELLRAMERGDGDSSSQAVREAAGELAARGGRAVFTTLGPEGVLVSDGANQVQVPGVMVTGEIDIVGAGDSTTAGIVAALCAGATPVQAAQVGCLVASITIQQIGVTGTATPDQLRSRLAEARWSGSEIG